MRYYEDILNALGMTCAQVLLTLDNLADRSQYINARNTFTELLAYGTIPVVSENDTVAVQELRFGDNDTLSAQVATLVEADYLFLMTDVDALYTANPKVGTATAYITGSSSVFSSAALLLVTVCHTFYMHILLVPNFGSAARRVCQSAGVTDSSRPEYRILNFSSTMQHVQCNQLPQIAFCPD
eukprot:GHRR01033970.1.p2 GENE.GHRR01033970.1~~GHRR01033970.1.p2  ORF type:complete len:183 (+),score=56.80 GHRR01033970.1:639-1187(+)